MDILKLRYKENNQIKIRYATCQFTLGIFTTALEIIERYRSWGKLKYNVGIVELFKYKPFEITVYSEGK